MLCFSIVLWLRGLGKSGPKNGRVRRICRWRRGKCAPRLRARTIWKSKSLKTDSVGTLFEFEDAKICTTPAREHDLEIKIVKNWEVRSTFGSWSRLKFAPRLRASTIWKSTSLKTESLGALLEVEVAKMCTTPAREHGLESKIVKTPGSPTTFWGSKLVQNAFHVAGAGVSTQHPHKNRKRSLKRIVIVKSSVCSTCHISRKSRRTASIS